MVPSKYISRLHKLVTPSIDYNQPPSKQLVDTGILFRCNASGEESSMG